MVNVDSWGGPGTNPAGFYSGGQITTVIPSETQTGGLLVKTVTIKYGQPTSTGVSFNLSLTSVLGVFGVENKTVVNIGVNVGATTSSNGVSLNRGVNFIPVDIKTTI